MSTSPTAGTEQVREVLPRRDFGALRKANANLCYLLIQRSASHAGLEDWSKAADDAKECVRLAPSFVKGYYRLAVALIELKDLDKAAATIQQGLRIDPNNPQLSKQLRAVRQLKKAGSSGNGALASNSLSHILPRHKLDDSTARELQDLQNQYAQTNREMGAVQANLNAIQQESRIAELTKAELQPLDGSTQCYRQIGKLFFRSTKDQVVHHLDEQLGDHKKKVKDLTSKMDYLERRLKSQKQNIDEIVKPIRSSE
jgi:chaperonin cofactor prefoldin